MNHSMGVSGSATSQFGPPQVPLHAVKQSPIDERFASISGSLESLESELDQLRKQLHPVMIESAKGEGGGTNAAPSPVECSIESTLRNYDYRITTAWQALSAIRAQLRV